MLSRRTDIRGLTHTPPFLLPTPTPTKWGHGSRWPSARQGENLHQPLNRPSSWSWTSRPVPELSQFQDGEKTMSVAEANQRIGFCHGSSSWRRHPASPGSQIQWTCFCLNFPWGLSGVRLGWPLGLPWHCSQATSVSPTRVSNPHPLPQLTNPTCCSSADLPAHLVLHSNDHDNPAMINFFNIPSPPPTPITCPLRTLIPLLILALSLLFAWLGSY